MICLINHKLKNPPQGLSPKPKETKKDTLGTCLRRIRHAMNTSGCSISLVLREIHRYPTFCSCSNELGLINCLLGPACNSTAVESILSLRESSVNALEEKLLCPLQIRNGRARKHSSFLLFRKESFTLEGYMVQFDR